MAVYSNFVVMIRLWEKSVSVSTNVSCSAVKSRTVLVPARKLKVSRDKAKLSIYCVSFED